MTVSRWVTGEDQVAILDSLVAGKAGSEHCLVGRFAVLKMSESPAVRRGVFPSVLDHELNSVLRVTSGQNKSRHPRTGCHQ